MSRNMRTRQIHARVGGGAALGSERHPRAFLKRKRKGKRKGKGRVGGKRDTVLKREMMLR
jgi:hypothetical protein